MVADPKPAPRTSAQCFPNTGIFAGVRMGDICYAWILATVNVFVSFEVATFFEFQGMSYVYLHNLRRFGLRTLSTGFEKEWEIISFYSPHLSREGWMMINEVQMYSFIVANGLLRAYTIPYA